MFEFWLPITGDPTDAATKAAYPDTTAPFTFTSVTLQVFDAYTGDATSFSQTFVLLTANNLPPGLTMVPGSLQAATPTDGARMEVSWTVPQVQWNNAVSQIFTSPWGYTWTVTGITTIIGGYINDASSYQSEHGYFGIYMPPPAPTAFNAGLAPTAFTATSAGNNTLDLTYNIVSADGTPGGTLNSVNVTLYASPSGTFDYSDNVPIAPIYSVTDPGLLTGSDPKVFSMDADLIGCGGYRAALQEFEFSSSELYVLAKVTPPSARTSIRNGSVSRPARFKLMTTSCTSSAPRRLTTPRPTTTWPTPSSISERPRHRCVQHHAHGHQRRPDRRRHLHAHLFRDVYATCLRPRPRRHRHR